MGDLPLSIGLVVALLMVVLVLIPLTAFWWGKWSEVGRLHGTRTFIKSCNEEGDDSGTNERTPYRR